MANLYLHIPFCKQRCIYCDFYFVTNRSSTPAFVYALQQEIMHWSARLSQEEPIETIYFGGGTPSLLPPHHVHDILQCIDAAFDATHVEEVTFELNPDDAGPDYLAALRQSGVDRLSIGIQSFQKQDLQWMNRAHTAQQAHDVIKNARSAGFENFSVDLIFGLPNQSMASWQHNLETVLELRAPHISTYSLTIEPRTPLFKRVEQRTEHPVEDDAMASLYRKTMDFFNACGYEHYEVSSFALPGYRALHNQSYWAHKNYLGMGPSAHSFWKKGPNSAVRWANERNLKRYSAWPETGELPVSPEETLTLEQLADEYIMLRLRTRDGIDLHLLKERYGRDLLSLEHDKLDGFQKMNVMDIDNEKGRLRLTPEGLLICDAITGALLA